MENLKVTAALLVALFQKPHDRLFLMELENDILDFIGSSAYTYQLKPMNSYYRLLSHQVAEYHGLQHTVSKDDDKCVIVYKQNNFRPNKGLILLQHLEPQVMYQFPPEYFALASMAAANNNQHTMQKNIRNRTRINSRSSQGDGIDDSQDRKKVVILKRESRTKPENEVILKESEENELPDQEIEQSCISIPNLEERRRLREEQYNQEKEKIFSSSPSSSTSISTPPSTPMQGKKFDTAGDDDSPQPHQFETSRFKFNRQNEMKQFRRPKFQGYNKKSFNSNGHHVANVSPMSIPIHPYYPMQSQINHMNSAPIPYGYPMIPPMDYLYYPMGAPTIGAGQVMVSSQPVYPIQSRPYIPYEKRGQINGGNNSKEFFPKNNGDTENGLIDGPDYYDPELAKLSEKLDKTGLA